jgi:hypothetical protein
LPFRRNLIALALCVVLATVAAVAPASAQQSQGSPVTEEQYGDSASGFSASTGDPGGTADPGASGSLPFTGLDLGLMAAAALALAGAGFVLRRRTASEEGA